MGLGDGSPHSRVAELINRIGRAAHCLQFTAGLNPAQWEALRYLARANRYSRSPTALAEFLCTTKGTASQTVRALEGKGYVHRERVERDRRSFTLELTEEGATLLHKDPMLRMERAAAELPNALGETVAVGLDSLLREFQNNCGSRAFGICEDCGHFRACGAAEIPNGPHRCGLVDDPLSDLDKRQICINFSTVVG